ncbi:MAG: DUF1203 domain-containing protein [Pseudomonadota bacterium]
MDFQISALDEHHFKHLVGATDEELAASGARRVVDDSNPGYPCRVSLRDARVGEPLILTNFVHLTAPGPYRASHAVFFIEGETRTQPDVNSVPPLFRQRLLSVRAFNTEQFMIGADVAPGSQLEACIENLSKLGGVDFLHIHNAKPGCYAAKVDFIR